MEPTDAVPEVVRSHKALRSPPHAGDIFLETHPFFMPSHKAGATPLPEVYDMSEQLKPPRDQGARSTCVSFASAAMKEYQEKQDINLVTHMSPEYIYSFRSTKSEGPDEGMYGRDAMQILQNYGSVPESYLPYRPHTADIPKPVIDKLTPIAANFKVKSFAQVTSIDGLKQSLFKCGPCLILFPVYSTKPEFWRKANDKDPSQGGHGVCVIGYNKEGFIIRNSWGPKWNGTGTVIYPYSDWGAAWEIWSSMDAKSQPVNLTTSGIVFDAVETVEAGIWANLKICPCTLL